jgi:Resolvase, N terminal domain
MLIGYARVSKADGSQLLDLQVDALREAGIATDRIYEDRMSGRHDQRPGLDACLKALREGDTLCVWKLDRLGRNLRHLVTLVDTLQGCGVGLRVLTGQGSAVDTTRGRRSSDLRGLRGTRRVRARRDLRADTCGPQGCSRSRPERWPTAQDDRLKDPYGDGCHGRP